MFTLFTYRPSETAIEQPFTSIIFYMFILQVPQPGKCGMAKVLVVGYMRGGTSVLGELFNQNPDALYWFEPLAGLYSALYGTQRNWRPLTILTRQNGQMRY